MTYEELHRQSEAVEDVVEALGKKNFLAAVFYVAEDGVLHLRRTTWAFPISRFNEAVRLLNDDLQREVALPKATMQPADLGLLFEAMGMKPALKVHDAQVFDPTEAARVRPTIDELHHQLGVAAHQNPIPEMPEDDDLGYHPLLEMPEDFEDGE